MEVGHILICSSIILTEFCPVWSPWRTDSTSVWYQTMLNMLITVFCNSYLVSQCCLRWRYVPGPICLCMWQQLSRCLEVGTKVIDFSFIHHFHPSWPLHLCGLPSGVRKPAPCVPKWNSRFIYCEDLVSWSLIASELRRHARRKMGFQSEPD